MGIKKSGRDTRIRYILKSADETVNNSDVLQNDNDFIFAGVANAVYLVDLSLKLVSQAAADWKMQWDLPSGASYLTGCWSTETVSAVKYLTNPDSIAQVNTQPFTWVRSIIVIGATAGNVTLQWAQDTADGSDTTIYQNSVMRIERIDTN